MVSSHFTSSKVSSILFSQKVWKLASTACQGLPKFSRPQRSVGWTNAKRKDNNKRLYLDFAKKSFHFSGFPYLHNSKEK
jgi:hypothetical protein